MIFHKSDEIKPSVPNINPIDAPLVGSSLKIRYAKMGSMINIDVMDITETIQIFLKAE